MNLRVSKRSLFLVAGLLALSPAGVENGVLAQQTEPGEELVSVDIVTEMVQLRYADPRVLSRILGYFGVEATAERDLNLVVIRGDRDSVQAAVAAVERLDVPPDPANQVNLAVYVVGAGHRQATETELPESLRQVLSQLENTLGYGDFSLLDSLLLRARAGSDGRVEGVFRIDTDGAETAYQFRFDRAEVIPGKERRTVRLLNLSFETIGRPDLAKAALNTDVEVREGQTVVVGKAAGATTALILVVRAEILD